MLSEKILDLLRMQEVNVENDKNPVLDEDDSEPVPGRLDREMMVKLNINQRVRPELLDKNLKLDLKATRKRQSRRSGLIVPPNRRSTSVNNQAKVSMLQSRNLGGSLKLNDNSPSPFNID